MPAGLRYRRKRGDPDAPPLAPLRLVPRFEMSIERAGLALGAGAVLVGGVACGLIWSGGERDPLAIAGGGVIGGAAGLFVLVAVGGPVWAAMHRAGLRRARHVAGVGFLAALMLLIGLQSHGFGLFAPAAMTGRAGLYHWLSAVALAVVPAGIAALIAAVMWRIAYRRAG